MTALTKYDVVSSKSDEYKFVTHNEVLYRLDFVDYNLYDYSDNAVVVKTMLLRREPPCVRGKGCNHKDERVYPTIGLIILDYLENNPDEALLVICDNEDKLAKARFRLFDRWHKNVDNIFAKYDTGERHHQDSFYASLVTRKDNPSRLYLQDVFRQSLARYLPEEESFPITDDEWFGHQEDRDYGEFPFHMN